MKLKIEGLSAGYDKDFVIKDLSLSVNQGEFLSLLGPSGCGKTTLMKAVAGILPAQGGRILLDGEDITGKSTIEINKEGIARTFQNIRLFSNMSVIRNVMVGLANRPEYRCNPFTSMLRLPGHFKTEVEMREKAKEILRIFGLEEERNNLSCNLPYGKQRKLEIARALATDPKLLLLDEPAAGMNPNETADLMNIVRFIRDNYDMTILLIEHDMKFVSGLCDEITVLNFGTELASGETKTVLSDPEVIKAYIGG